jgi:hypothetical protein
MSNLFFEKHYGFTPVRRQAERRSWILLSITILNIGWGKSWKMTNKQ